MIESYIKSGKGWEWDELRFIGYSAPETKALRSLIPHLTGPGKRIFVTGWNDMGFFVGREGAWRELAKSMH